QRTTVTPTRPIARPQIQEPSSSSQESILPQDVNNSGDNTLTPQEEEEESKEVNQVEQPQPVAVTPESIRRPSMRPVAPTVTSVPPSVMQPSLSPHMPMPDKGKEEERELSPRVDNSVEKSETEKPEQQLTGKWKAGYSRHHGT